ncbi:MAG: hypothetical protein HYY84_10085 [Deltaproteobacteria bacterium]|nr:hypothetical protein [Deltaproteobacteria bacterium]
MANSIRTWTFAGIMAAGLGAGVLFVGGASAVVSASGGEGGVPVTCELSGFLAENGATMTCTQFTSTGAKVFDKVPRGMNLLVTDIVVTPNNMFPPATIVSRLWLRASKPGAPYSRMDPYLSMENVTQGTWAHHFSSPALVVEEGRSLQAGGKSASEKPGYWNSSARISGVLVRRTVATTPSPSIMSPGTMRRNFGN